DHEMTAEMLKDVRPNIVNLTRFSERPGTAAAGLENKLHGRTIKARSREFTELCQKISLELNKSLVGSVHKVLTTERNIGQYENTTLARTDEYRPVVIDEVLSLGEYYKVKIASVTEAYLRGKIN
ncbi:MAG: TRAM domain-containing protein, partial [Thermoplasmata archaeon]